MEQDFEIELEDETHSEENSIQLPMNFITIGTVENDDAKVYIHQNVYKALEKFASSDTSKELGSIILGDFSQAMDKTNVVISDYIEAKYTDASASTLTFTHDTWDYIYKEHTRHAPDKKIIGWQHTHPNYGIFLSNYDMFIQENFFNLPFQVAYVIDPIQNLRGFFQWKNGKIEKLKGFYIYDDIGKPIKIPQSRQAAVSPPSKFSKASTMIIAILCACIFGLSLFSYQINKKYQAQLDLQTQITKELDIKNDQTNSQKNSISKLQDLLVSGILNGTPEDMASQILELTENREILWETQEELLLDLQTYLKNRDDLHKSEKGLYYVRKNWEDTVDIFGIFIDQKVAEKCAQMHPGYSVFDETGNVVYDSLDTDKLEPFRARVSIDVLNIRTGPGINYDRVRFCDPGEFTITEVQPGTGSANGWGMLSSGEGWISLDYARKIQ